MPLSVVLLLAVSAFICTILSALNRCPVWIAVMILCVIALLGVMPLGTH